MSEEMKIEIDLSSQQMTVFLPNDEIFCYPVSTAKNGAGELFDSECTPRGRHRVSEKIGEGAAINTVFVGRVPTGEVYSEEFAKDEGQRDWILTRIIWLEGCEPGKNEGGNVDTKRRYIYIHGTPDSTPLRMPGSRGCIRMKNMDVIDLFEKITIGTRVDIIE